MHQGCRQNHPTTGMMPQRRAQTRQLCHYRPRPITTGSPTTICCRSCKRLRLWIGPRRLLRLSPQVGQRTP
eukprot:56609-Eustigmatos_ZCMA.PRE.1